MINNRGMTRARAGAAMLACGTAALFALAGCSSGGSSSPSSSAPSWASALGSGVTVVAPETTAPGNDSPGAVMTGFIDAINAKKYTALCSYLLPSDQSKCRTVFGSVNMSALAGQMPTDKNIKLGYVAIDGTEALIGMTGEECAPGQSPECSTNNSPAAILDSGKSFSALWKTAVAEANSSSSSNAYTLSPCVEIGGKWYADQSLS
jgi:hypothetical protein